MRDLKIEITDNGSAVYIGIEPPGHCICTTQPSELIMVDWDGADSVMGVELIGSAARYVLLLVQMGLVVAQDIEQQSMMDIWINLMKD